MAVVVDVVRPTPRPFTSRGVQRVPPGARVIIHEVLAGNPAEWTRCETAYPAKVCSCGLTDIIWDWVYRAEGAGE